MGAAWLKYGPAETAGVSSTPAFRELAVATDDRSKIESKTEIAPGEVLRAYAINELANAIACLAWRGARLHAGIHQARKSMRRTRAALALGGSVLGRGGQMIDGELQRVVRSLSSLRDTQALVEALQRLTEKDQAPTTHPLLERARRTAVRQRMLRARAAVRDDNAFLPEIHTLLTVLAAGLRILPWSGVRDEEVQAALQRSASKAGAASKRAMRSGRDEDWHRWRRRARRLSQQHRALGDPPGSALALDKSLAVLLGEAQDYALLIDHCGTDSPFTFPDRQELRAIAEKRVRRLRTKIAKTSSKASS